LAPAVRQAEIEERGTPEKEGEVMPQAPIGAISRRGTRREGSGRFHCTGQLRHQQLAEHGVLHLGQERPAVHVLFVSRAARPARRSGPER